MFTPHVIERWQHCQPVGTPVSYSPNKPSSASTTREHTEHDRLQVDGSCSILDQPFVLLIYVRCKRWYHATLASDMNDTGAMDKLQRCDFSTTHCIRFSSHVEGTPGESNEVLEEKEHECSNVSGCLLRCALRFSVTYERARTRHAHNIFSEICV